MKLQVALAFALALVADPLLAQGELERVLEGFDDVLMDRPPANGFNADPGLANAFSPGESPSRIQFEGRLSQRFVFNVAHEAPPPSEIDRRGLSSMRTRLDLAADARLGSAWKARVEGHLSLDPAAHGARDGPERPIETSDVDGREAEIDEFFIQGPVWENLDVTLGRQILTWGRSELLRVTDVLNPVDNRLPGLADIKDYRLPVTALRLDRYSDPWRLSMIAIPERRFDKLPGPSSDFFSGSGLAPPRAAPDGRFGTPELALAVNGTFPGWDISLYAARIFDDRPHLETTPAGERHLHHDRITMAGVAGNIVRGSWLIKTEVALFTGLRFANTGARRFSRLATLGGIEYSGIADTTIVLEAQNQHIADFDDRLALLPDDRRRNEPATTLRVQRAFLNNSLDVSFLALDFGNGSAVRRLQFDYAWSDTLQLSTGLVTYQSGEQAPFREIGNNDRLFAILNVHF